MVEFYNFGDVKMLVSILFWLFAVTSIIRIIFWGIVPVGSQPKKIEVASKVGGIVGGLLTLTFLWLIHGSLF